MTTVEYEVGTDVEYARIHEFGGVIRPRRASHLVFQIDGQWVRTTQVNMPARPYMRPAADESVGEVKREVQRAFNTLINGFGI